MTITYVLVASQHAEQLSRSIMRLLRPTHLRDEQYTDLYCSLLTHPTNGESAILIPSDETVWIHAEATGEELSVLLDTFVADGGIEAQEAAGIMAAVQANRGQQVKVKDFVPQSWSTNVLTQEQMVAAGWFDLLDNPETEIV